MTVKDINELIEGSIITKNGSTSISVTSGFVGDLLSVVMGNAQEGCAWITIQSHINIVAVASLVGVSCIVVAEGFKVDEDAKEKAEEKEITIIESDLTAYQICCKLAVAGLD